MKMCCMNLSAKGIDNFSFQRNFTDRIERLMQFTLPFFSTIIIFLFSLIVFKPVPSPCLEDDLAKTPPMGWNSWNTFRLEIHENLVKGITDVMIETGMRDAGYRYICIDDGWMLEVLDEKGGLIVDENKFPSGLKALGDYIHKKGLKFGLYLDAGVKTCGGFAGSYGHEELHAQQFADWGVDFIKIDFCFTHSRCLENPDCNKDDGPIHAYQGHEAFYKKWYDAINKTGRPIIISICEWGWDEPWKWGHKWGHMFRTTGDIRDSWGANYLVLPQVGEWVLGPWTGLLDRQIGLEPYNGPGHWNDPDMMIVGMKNLNNQEYRAQFTMWCILAAPLIAGNDIRDMDPVTIETLTNPEVIAVNQDPLGRQGTRVRKNGDLEVWAKPLMDNEWAVAFFNRGGFNADISVHWEDLELSPAASIKIRDLWKKSDTGTFTQSFSATVPYHSTLLFKFSPQKKSSATPENSWRVKDIGYAWIPGRIEFQDTFFTVYGSGRGIDETVDEFTYAYQTLDGDGEIVLQVENLEETNWGVKAGVMVRQNLNNDSPYVFLAMGRQRFGVTFQYRQNQNSQCVSIYKKAGTPHWLKLVRKGDVVTAYDSSNGKQWQKIASTTINLGQKVYIGLAATPAELYKQCAVTCANMKLTGKTE